MLSPNSSSMVRFTRTLIFDTAQEKNGEVGRLFVLLGDGRWGVEIGDLVFIYPLLSKMGMTDLE